ncbi:predicted protein [Nematostella vectensis]|uniref:Uncharacterized protein n=1 Tax=Nematostella vectensis TaxID=45351 RepID=A7RML1_NEMVE|nr:predicted protein [Nematostella vectensis]|eukprot:XP_001639352.1 predicted protein [Nematostella vectensis]
MASKPLHRVVHRTESGSSTCSTKSNDSYSLTDWDPEIYQNTFSPEDYENLVTAQNAFPEYFTTESSHNSKESQTDIRRLMQQGQEKELKRCTSKSKKIAEWFMHEYGILK